MTGMTEEPWEADIGSMLGRLPSVDPPPGFIDDALDHRPMYAGRTLAAVVTVSVVAMVAAISSGAAGRNLVEPRIDDLALRHTTAVQAGVLGSVGSEVDFPVQTPVEMPDGFERTHNLEAEDIRQAVYAGGDEAVVSVFVQQGRVQWASLAPAGLTEIDGRKAFFDETRLLTVVETNEDIVTIVGLPLDEVGRALESVGAPERSIWERANDAVGSITRQLGYPDVD